ncbi:MAG: TetR/AcrR family transcriptional regulator [Planctomycetota bacterium]|jgi:AcrR family transcriptional regulator
MSARLGRNDWLAQALETLRREGVAGVRVERLARSLGVTKGSFYWHFEDRQDLLDRMLDYWAEELTTRVLEEIDRIRGTPEERLLALMKLVTLTERGRYDVAFRAWASIDRRAARTVRQVDERRLDGVRKLFAELGFCGRELEMRTRLFLCYQVGEAGLLAREGRAERRALLALRHELLTGPRSQPVAARGRRR